MISCAEGRRAALDSSQRRAVEERLWGRVDVVELVVVYSPVRETWDGLLVGERFAVLMVGTFGFRCTDVPRAMYPVGVGAELELERFPPTRGVGCSPCRCGFVSVP